MTDEEKVKQDKETLLNEITLQVKSLVSESTKDGAKKEDIEKAVKELNEKIKGLGGDSEALKTLNERVEKLAKENEVLIKASKEQGEVMAKMKNDTGTPAKRKSFREAIKDAIMEKKDMVLTTKNDDNGERLSLKDYFVEKGNKNSPLFTIKDGVDVLKTEMLESSIVQSNVQLLRLTELDPRRVGIPLTVYPHVLEVFPQKQLNRPSMSVLVAYSYADGVGTKTEGGASSISSFLFKTVEFKSFTIATFFTMSDETLDDLGEALDEISIIAPDKILDSIDSKILQDGGNGTTDIMGLFVGGTTCTDFVPATYASLVAGANIIDLISKMKLSIRKLKYKPNFVALNATDIDNIGSLKDQLDNSISDRRLVFNANGELVKICGLTVVENDAITADQCVVGDTSQAIIGIRKAITMEIGLNAADFTEGQKTVRLTTRLAFGVRDKAAFMFTNQMAADTTTITLS